MAVVLLAAGGVGCAGAPSGSATEVRGLRVSAAPTRAATVAAEGPAETTITISAIGDCAIGDLRRGGGAPGSFRYELGKVDDPVRYPFSGVAAVLRADDLTIANLEGTLTEHPGAINPVFSIRGKPEYAQMLVAGGVEIVNVDNNHSHDYGVVGHSDTKAALERAGVGYFGRGREDRQRIKGLEIVNLGYLGGPPGTRERVVRDVKRVRQTADLVIVSFHWGLEGSHVVMPGQRRLGQATIDAGADLVLGHHPHVVQGIESYRGRPIVYSLGNFVFGANSQPKDMDSMIFQARFRYRDGQLQGVEPLVVPVRISSVTRRNDFRPVILDGAEGERVSAKVRDLSRVLGPGVDG